MIARAVSVRVSWAPIVDHAAAIVEGYDTGVTLRQLFYRLVADGTLPNTPSAYKSLSRQTAQARRSGWFPALIDRGRVIHRFQTFNSPGEARSWLGRIYRRDRTEEQDVSLYLGVEKAGIVEQLTTWFGDLGIPIVALGGYSSQTYVDAIAADARRQGRPAVLIYAGDFDPSGEDIDRDFVARAGCFAEVVRVALSAAQVDAYGLPPALGKATDSRARQFVARHGRPVQVELDALPPDTLRELYRDAIARYSDVSTYERAVAREAVERLELAS